MPRKQPVSIIFSKLIAIMFLIIAAAPVWGQSERFTLNGIVSDDVTGEVLIGVSVHVIELQRGTSTNEYGFYSITFPRGSYRVEVSYVGYRTDTIAITARTGPKLNIRMKPSSTVLQEVVVSSEQTNRNITQSEMSVERLTSSIIKSIPAMMGEVDVIKAMQLLPGVQPVSEGSSNFSVRGGGYDQNLILLDEATVYSASHLLGFFSVFNNDAIKDAKLYKGDIPATFGGRLSSLMDVRTKDGNNQRFSGTGGIGTISSRLTLESPIFTDKVSFLLSGRRTYADIFLKMQPNEDLRNTQLYFYDVNAKLNYRIGDNDRVYVAGYFGRDYFSMPMADMGFGNKTLTARWNHIYSPRLFSNLTFIASEYDYHLGSSMTPEIAMAWDSKMRDLGGKLDFSFNLNEYNDLKFGYQIVHHTIEPGVGGGTSTASTIQSFELDHLYGLEHAFYVSNEMTLLKKLKLRYGLRYAFYHNFGNGKEIVDIENYQIVSRRTIEKGKLYNTNHGLEPRLGVSYAFNDKHAIKASYARSAQYIQLASNSSAGSPLDIWFPASQNTKPQISDQVVLGYFRNFWDNQIETSAEIYYKNFTNVVDFKDRANLMGNNYIDSELRYGRGYAYGLELMVRKNGGKWNGWISYTYSRSMRKIDEVNNNNWYRSPFYKPHNISIVLNYDFAKRWSASASWVYATGMPVTYPEGRYLIGGSYVPIPSERNAYRYPDYHRLDLSVTWRLTNPAKRFQSDLNFSLYNAYGRKNPWTIYFTQEESNPNQSYAEMIYLFTFVPSITWNFSF